jgi:hypothetical protein
MHGGRPTARARGALLSAAAPAAVVRAHFAAARCARDGMARARPDPHRTDDARSVRRCSHFRCRPARLERTAQRSRRRRYAPLHTLAYPECVEHFSVLVYSGRLTRHCPRLLHPCNPRHDDRARRCRRRRRGHGPAVRRDVQVGGELVARTHGRGGAPACTQQYAQLERDAWARRQ